MVETPLPRARLVRQRRRYGLWLLVGILLVLIGRGLGLAGNEAEPSDAAERRDPVATAPARGASEGVAEPATPPGKGDEPRPAAPTSEANESQPAAPAGETSAPSTSTAAAPAPAPAQGFDADRFATLTSAVTTYTAMGQLGDALATLHHLRGLPLDGAQRTALLAVAGPLEDALAAACARIVEAICGGRVLLARDELDRWFADGASFAEPWLDSALRAAGLAGGLLRPVGPHDELLPTSRPLPRGREVRVGAASHKGPGTIADSRSEQVTVRMQTATGWSFPTVPTLSCEPVQPTAEEAIEMGLLAVQARDGLLARLWLAVASARSPRGLGERGERLAAVLR